MIREHELVELGFVKQDILASESGDKNDYYYYSLKLNDEFILISAANDEVQNGQWNVFCYEIKVTIKDIEDLQTLIALYSKWKKNK